MATEINSTTATISKPDLDAHLRYQHNTQISQISQLDHNVFKIERKGGPSWVARVFDSSRPTKAVEGDAEILRFLEQRSFPAERCALPEPVSITPDGQSVLVTTFIEGRRPGKGEKLFFRLGELLGRLHSMEIESGSAEAIHRKGGAWHHICNDGGPKEEIQAALTMIDKSRENAQNDQQEMYEKLKRKLEQVENFDDLPHAFVHPDFVPENVITSHTGDLVLVDWVGAGIGSRVASLGFLLCAAGYRSMAQVEAVVEGYRKHVSLTEGEMRRLRSAICFRPLVLRCWEVCTGRRRVEDAIAGIAKMGELTERIVSTVSNVLRGGDEEEEVTSDLET
jgi:thiamine kinase-like enzyme